MMANTPKRRNSPSLYKTYEHSTRNESIPGIFINSRALTYTPARERTQCPLGELSFKWLNYLIYGYNRVSGKYTKVRLHFIIVRYSKYSNVECAVS